MPHRFKIWAFSLLSFNYPSPSLTGNMDDLSIVTSGEEASTPSPDGNAPVQGTLDGGIPVQT